MHGIDHADHDVLSLVQRNETWGALQFQGTLRPLFSPYICASKEATSDDDDADGVPRTPPPTCEPREAGK